MRDYWRNGQIRAGGVYSCGITRRYWYSTVRMLYRRPSPCFLPRALLHSCGLTLHLRISPITFCVGFASGGGASTKI